MGMPNKLLATSLRPRIAWRNPGAEGVVSGAETNASDHSIIARHRGRDDPGMWDGCVVDRLSITCDHQGVK